MKTYLLIILSSFIFFTIILWFKEYKKYKFKQLQYNSYSPDVALNLKKSNTNKFIVFSFWILLLIIAATFALITISLN